MPPPFGEMLRIGGHSTSSKSERDLSIERPLVVMELTVLFVENILLNVKYFIAFVI